MLVMGALSPEELEVALAARADVVAWREAFVAARCRPARGVHVKLDTGMGRLGTRDPEEATRVAEAVAAARPRLAGAMTHFATADDDPGLRGRAARGLHAVGGGDASAAHPGVLVHAANSAATLREPAARFDLVRCGIAIYGLDPFQEDPAEHGLEPALTLRLLRRRGQDRRARARAPATAAASWPSAPTWIGTVPIGYADGVRRALTNNADVLVEGRRVPLVGTVSMDNITVDLGDGAAAAVGEEAVLIGRQGGERILAEEVARRLGTINYEVTCGISGRVPRAYVS